MQLARLPAERPRVTSSPQLAIACQKGPMDHPTALAEILPPDRPLNALTVLAGQLGDDAHAANLRRDAESSRGTRKPNTERALLGDVLRFTAWCTGAGLAHLPAAAETVARFFDAQAEAGKATATIKRH